MKLILLVICFMFAIDVFVFGLILQNVLTLIMGSVLFLSLVLLAAFLFRRIKTKSRTHIREGVSGFKLGQGVELTNPERPKNCDVIIPDSALKLGFLGVGSPGSGKTFSLGVGYTQDRQRRFPEQGWGITDGKGDIDYYLDLCRANCKPDYFFSSELEGSDSINLMEGDPYDVVERLSRVLIGETASTSFYSDEQRVVLTKIIPALVQLDTPVHLRDLYAILTVEDAAQDFLSRARDCDIDETDFILCESYFEQNVDDRVRLISGLLNKLYIFVAGSKTDRLNVYQPDININHLMNENKKVFFHLPYSKFAIDLAVAIVEMFGVEAKNRQLSGNINYKPFSLLFEDYGGFFHDNFSPIASRCRSAQMPVNFTFQSFAQLEKVDRTFLDELDDTVQTKIIFRVMGDMTGNRALKLLGDYETRDLSGTEMENRKGVSVTHTRQNRIELRQLREQAAGMAYISTILEQGNGKVTNPLYQVRFPAPDFIEGEFSLPASKKHSEGEGASFWTNYMSPSRLAELNNEIQESILGKAEAFV